jgi:hypothetical protein
VNANDAQLIEILTAQHGSTIQDNAPNAPAPGQGAAPTFDVVVEGNAGNVIGNSAAPYTLTVTAMDLTAMTAANLNPVIPAQSFSAPLWNKNGPDDYDTQQSFTINVPNPNPYAGHVLQYVASLVTVNDQVVSILMSEPFTLV